MVKLIGGIALLASAVGLVSCAYGVSPIMSAAIAAVVAGAAVVILFALLLSGGDR